MENKLITVRKTSDSCGEECRVQRAGCTVFRKNGIIPKDFVRNAGDSEEDCDMMEESSDATEESYWSEDCTRSVFQNENKDDNVLFASRLPVGISSRELYNTLHRRDPRIRKVNVLMNSCAYVIWEKGVNAKALIAREISEGTIKDGHAFYLMRTKNEEFLCPERRLRESQEQRSCRKDPEFTRAHGVHEWDSQKTGSGEISRSDDVTVGAQDLQKTRREPFMILHRQCRGMTVNTSVGHDAYGDSYKRSEPRETVWSHASVARKFFEARTAILFLPTEKVRSKWGGVPEKWKRVCRLVLLVGVRTSSPLEEGTLAGGYQLQNTTGFEGTQTGEMGF